MINWQVYKQNGSVSVGKSTNKKSAFSNVISHAAVHIWIWRLSNSGAIELLFQIRSGKKDHNHKAGKLDISIAGHIDYGETTLNAATREAYEEIGLVINQDDLYLAGVEHYKSIKSNVINDEFRFIYTLLWDDKMSFNFNDGEVQDLVWLPILNASDIVKRTDYADKFINHTQHYYNIVFEAIKNQTQS